ncbi:MAG: aspartate-alanine antiporter [Muribaculaceae bacterium]|nr:aspartate-alanine antiporter [Muribaculaceae bacterium]
MDWLITILRQNPSLPIFLTIGIGFFVGQLKYKSFSLGTVTSVLLVGVLVGQLDIAIPGPIKNAFFLLFLFAIGYSVGPQFFQALKGDGIKQVIFAVVVCVLCLLCTWGVSVLMGYNIGEAVGLLAGAQTMSAVIGVGTDTIASVGGTPEEKKAWLDIIPVCYAVTYVFGTVGSAYILANLGPALLGGIKKVKAETAELEKKMNNGSANSDPNYINALRPVAFRAYKAEADFFSTSPTVAQIEAHLSEQGRRLFVERVRIGGSIIDPTPDTKVSLGDEIVLSGRREYIIGDEKWIGSEVNDGALLDFPAEQLRVLVSKKGAAGLTVDQVRTLKPMYGVSIKSITRGGTPMPVLAQMKLQAGDTVTIVGLAREVNTAAAALGVADKQTEKSNLILLGLGIFLGGLFGALAIHIGNVPISLSTSGGALISGLICGWLRARRPSIGRIPSSAVWILNNLGLNMFIAVIGITSGPSFVSGLKEVGFMLFFMGVVATSLPLILGMIIGKTVFKFPAAINLGCCAGSRTTTASLGAVQEAIGSTIPAMGYTVTYAIGNTLLILWGVVIVLLMG